MSGTHFPVMDPNAKVVASGGDRVVVELGWSEAEGAERTRLFQVLTFRDEKIVGMQDCGNRRDALRAAGLG